MTITYTTSAQIPVRPVPSQTINATLSGQAVSLNIYWRGGPNGNLYMDVASNGTTILAGVICQHGNAIVRDGYFGFTGDFAWWDTTTAAADPNWTGLGSRWVLVYYSP